MEKIGRFEIVGKLGRGAFGMVYKGRDPVINRLAAIKVMSEATVGDPELVARFKREAEAAGGLNHKNIVTIYDLGEHNGLPYIAMEFLEGKDLEKILKDKTELSMEKRIDIMAQTAEGLHYAHTKGIVHRDVKPANIRLLEDGTVKIMDFGIAKMSSSDMTRTGQFMGTVNYMSPEQIKAKKVDGRSDLFALGVMFYEFISFRRPFPGDSITAVIYKIVNENPPPLTELHGTPHEWLEGVVFKCLEKDATKRWESCQEFADALRARIRVGITVGASTVDQTINIARQSADAGDIDTAIRQLDQILEQDPENSNALKQKKSILATLAVKQTDSLISSGRLEQARDQLLKAKTEVGETEEIQKALEVVQERIRSSQAEQLLTSAQRYLADKRVDAAIDALQKARDLDPYNEKVRETLSQATDEKRKADVELLLADAKARVAQGRLQEAGARVQKALELDPHSLAARTLAQAIERDIEIASRKAEVDDAILQGRAALKREDFDKAVALFDRALALDPTSADAKREKVRVEERKGFVEYMTKGQQLLTQKKYSAAAQAFENATKLDPASDDARLGLQAARQKRTSLEAAPSRGVPMGLVAAIVALVLVVGGGLAWFLTRPTPAALAIREGDAARAAEDLKTAEEKYLAAATNLEGKDAERKAAKAKFGALYEPLLVQTPMMAKTVLDQVRSWDGADATRDRYLDLGAALSTRGIAKSEPELIEGASSSYQTYLEKYDKLKDRDTIKAYAKLGDDVVETADNAKTDAASRLKLYDQAQKLYSFIDVTDPSLNTFAKMNEVRAKRTQLAERMDQITKFDADAKALVATAQAKEKGEATYSEAIGAYDGLLRLVAQNEAIRDFVDLDDMRSLAEDGKRVLVLKLGELAKTKTDQERKTLLVAQAESAERSGQLAEAVTLYGQLGDKARADALTKKIAELSTLKSEIQALLKQSKAAEADVKLAAALAIAPSDNDLAGFQSTLGGLKRTADEQGRVAAALKAADDLKAAGKLDEAEQAYRTIVSSDPTVVASINRATEELRLARLQAQIEPIQKDAEAQEAAGNLQGALDGWKRIDGLFSTQGTQGRIADLTRKVNQQLITQLEGELDAAFKGKDAGAMDAATVKIEKLDPTNAGVWRVRKARALEALGALDADQASAFLKGKRPNDPEIAAIQQKIQELGGLQQALNGAEAAVKAANRDEAVRLAQSAVQSATRLGLNQLLTRAQDALARAKALPDPRIAADKAAAEKAAADKAAADKAAADRLAADRVAAERAAADKAAADKAAADKAAAATAAASGQITSLVGGGDWIGAARALDQGSAADPALSAKVYYNASRLSACDASKCDLPASKAWAEKAVGLDPTAKKLLQVVGGNWKSCADPTLVTGCQVLRAR